jgi:hypothetical protein
VTEARTNRGGTLPIDDREFSGSNRETLTGGVASEFVRARRR